MTLFEFIRQIDELLGKEKHGDIIKWINDNVLEKKYLEMENRIMKKS